MRVVGFSLSIFFPVQLLANPLGGNVVAGGAGITSVGTTTTITQSTDKAVIDWSKFDVQSNELVDFRQPSQQALTLNRVNDTKASQIDGRVTANGRIFIVNQNGVVFGRDAKVDVNGVIATSADIDNQKFMDGKLEFDRPGNANATIENNGSITAKDAGLVGLVAPNVINRGVITAKLGRVQLASGDRATVDLYGDQLMEVTVSDAVQSQLVDNSGKISAAGGSIALTAAAGRNMVNSLITVSGELSAPSVGMKNGKIVIAAEGSNAVKGNLASNKGKKSGSSTVIVSGKIDVSNAEGKAGSVEITADHIALTPTASINATGLTAGGQVHVGGQYLGLGGTPTASITVMQAGALIDASATGTAGAGGEVIMYADNRTEFGGSIRVNGGSEQGDGGFVETSGRVAVLAYGNVTAISRRGRKGTWLLDPADIEITNADANATAAPNFSATNTGSTVSAATIKTSLDNNVDVTILTSNDGYAGNGDIIVSSAISTTGTGALTLSAYRNILVNSTITLQGGSLTLRSNNAGAADGSTGVGGVSIAAEIATNGGNITIGGGSAAITAGSGFAVGSDATLLNGVIITAAADAGGGHIIINGLGTGPASNSPRGGVSIANGLTTSGSGTITLTGRSVDGSGNSTRGVRIYSGAVVRTSNGDIIINGTGGGDGNSINNYGVYVANTGTAIRTTGAGNIIVTGIGGNLSGGGTGSNHGIYLSTDNTVQSIQTTGSGNITLKGVAGGSTSYGLLMSSTTGMATTGSSGTRAISIYTDSLGTNLNVSAAGILTIAPYSNIGMSLGASVANTLNISDAQLANLIAGSYVFGSLTTATGASNSSAAFISTSRDFGDRNLTVVSGQDIVINGTLTKGTGTGTATYTFQAARDIRNNNLASILANSGSANLIFNADYDGNSSGSISFVGGTLNAANLTMSGGTNLSTGYAYGTAGRVEGVLLDGVTINATGTVLVRGHGYDTGSNSVGVMVQNGAKLQLAGPSNGLTMVGVGGSANGATANHGVVVTGSGSTISGTSGATLSVLGTQVGVTSGVYGVYVAGGGAITTVNGSLVVSSNSSGTGSASIGTYVVGTGSVIEATGTGSVNVGGNPAGGGSYTIQVENGGRIGSNSGALALTGTIFTGANNNGVYLKDGGIIRSTSGAMSISMATTGTSPLGLMATGTGNIVGGASSGPVTIAMYGTYDFSNLTIQTTGSVTFRAYLLDSNKTLAVGSGTANTVITDTGLGRVTAGSYVFMTTGTTGDLTINTGYDFGDKNASFISGQDIIVARDLIKQSGAGTAAYTLQANRTIYNSGNAGIKATSGIMNLTLQSDRDATGGGAINFTNGTFNSNGGTILMGGGTGSISPGVGYASAPAATYFTGISLTGTTVDASGGAIVMNGNASGYFYGIFLTSSAQVKTSGTGTIDLYGLGGTGSSNSAGVQLASGAISTTGTGAITINGTSGQSGANNHGVNIAGTVSGGGAVNIVGAGQGTGSNGTNYGVYISGGGTVKTTGASLLTVTGTGGNIAGTGDSNHGVYVAAANGITATGTGSILINGIQGGQATSFGLYTDVANAITAGTGTVTVRADSLSLGNTNAINTSGAITLAAYSNIGVSIGNVVASTLNIGNTQLANINGASYVFGATTTGTGTANTANTTLNTSYDFADKNVTVVAGQDISLEGTLAKQTGTGTATYKLQANGSIYNSNNAVLTANASAGKINIVINSDYDQATSPGGAVALSGGTFNTRGGTIVIGGGLNPLAGYALGTATYMDGVAISSALRTDAATGGSITVNGQGYGVGSNNGVYRNGGNWFVSGANITVNAIASGVGAAFSVNNGSALQATNGDITINATTAAAASAIRFSSTALITVGTGNIYLNAIQGNINLSLATSVITSAGNLTVRSDSIAALAGPISVAGTVTIAPYTNIGMSIGTAVASTLNIDSTALANVTAASYVFGSVTTATGAANTSDLTINTGVDFVDRNVTFISGRDINLAGTLTKATGTGTATYTFQANRDIYNSSNAGIAATNGKINILLNADYDQATALGGRIFLAGGTFNSNGGTITLSGGADVATGYAYGRSGAFEGVLLMNSVTLNAGAGALVIRGHGYDNGNLTVGVYTNYATVRTSSGSLSIKGIGGNNGSNDATSEYGIGLINTTVASTGGLIDLNATGGGTSAGNGGTNYGLYLTSASVTNTSGNIAVNATGGGRGTGTNNYGIYITTAGSTIATTGGGLIALNGIRGGGDVNSNYGFYADVANAVQTSGAGTITIRTDYLNLTTASTINSASTLTIAPYSNIDMSIGSGTNGLQLTNTLLGYITASGYVFGSTTTGTGTANTSDINLNTSFDFGDKNLTFISGRDIVIAGTLTKSTGSAPGGVQYLFQANRDIYNSNLAGITVSSGRAYITLQADYDQATALGGAVTFTNGGISTNGGDLTIGGGSNIATGYAYGWSGNVIGVQVTSGASFNTGSGTITIRGHGYDSGTDNYGVYINGTVGNNSNTVTVTGVGGGGSDRNYGIYVTGTGRYIRTSTGTVTVTGSSAGTGSDNYGVYLTSGGKIYSLGSAPVSVTGTGGGTTAGNGANNHGIYITGSNAAIRSDSGAVTVSGTGGGGTGTGGNNKGIVLSAPGGGIFITTGSATLSVTGNGAATTNPYNIGVQLDSGDIAQQGSGALTLTGTGGGAGAATNNYGLLVQGTGHITTAGGLLTVSGLGGNLSGSGSSNGGIVASSTGGIATTGNGNMILNAEGGGSGSTAMSASGANIITTAGTGAITLYTDTLSLNAATNIVAGGVLTIAPYSSIGMSVGAAVTNTFNLSTVQLGYISGASYVFGSTTTASGAANSGDATVNTAYDFVDKDVSFVSGQDINLAGNLIKQSGTGTATYLFQANRDIYNSNSAGVYVSAGTDTVAGTADDPGKLNLVFNSDRDQATVPGGAIVFANGTFRSNGGNITLSGGADVTTGYAYGTGTNVAGIKLDGAKVIADGGVLTARGHGYDGASSAAGIYIVNAGALTTTSGALTVTGVGGTGSGFTKNIGVYVFGSSSAIYSTGGTTTVTGTGNATGAANSGVRIEGGSRIGASNGTGSLTINGYGSTNGSGSSYGILLYTTGRILNGSGAVTLNGTAGSGTEAYGVRLNTDSGGLIQTTGGAVNIYTDALSVLNTTTAVDAGGVLTIAPLSNGRGMVVGAVSSGVLNIEDAALPYLTGSAYIFGSATSGNMTINTGADFGDKNVSILAGGNITFTGNLLKQSGTGTVTYLFKANGNVSSTNPSTVGANSGFGKVNAIFWADADQTTSPGGYVSFSTLTVNTRGGDIIVAGGADNGANGGVASDGLPDNYAYRSDGVGITLLNTTLDAGGGHIILYGSGLNRGVYLGGGNTVVTSGNGTITMRGIANYPTGQAYGIAFQSATANNLVQSGDGAIRLYGSGTGTSEIGIAAEGSANTNRIYSTGNGAIYLHGTSSVGNFDVYYPNLILRSDGTGAIDLVQNALSVSTTGFTVNTGGIFTVAVRAGNVTIGVGSGGTISIDNTRLANITATGYVFDTTAGTGDINVNTSRDFGDANLTFNSGRDITIAGSLTKGTGSGTATYNFNAARHITNNSAVGIAATSGKVNLTFDADTDNDTVGEISLNGGTFTTAGGLLRFKDALTLLADVTLNSSGGAVTLDSTVNGNTAGTRSLTVNAGTGLFTSTGIIGGTYKLNNFSITADDVAIGANIYGSGTLVIQPSTLTLNTAVGGAAGTYLDVNEVPRLQGGWSGITLGTGSTNNNNFSNIYSSAWSSPVTFTSGYLQLMANAALTSSNGASITFGKAVNQQTGASINAAGSVIYNGNVNMGASSTTAGANITFNNTLLVYGNTTLTANSGTVTLNYTNFSAGQTSYDLTVSGQSIAFSGSGGGSSIGVKSDGSAGTPLKNLSLTSVNSVTLPSISAASITVTVTGATSDITLPSGKLLTSGATTGTGISLTAGRDVIINSSTPVSMAGGSLSFSAGGATKLNTAVTYSTGGGAISFTGPVVLGADVTLNSANGAVTFGGTLNGDAAGTRSLTVNAGTGTFTTNGVVGGSNKLKDLNIMADDVALGADLFGGGTLTLSPSSAGKIVRLNYGTGDFNLDATELGYIKDGWNSLLIGHTNNATAGDMVIGAATWNDTVTLRSKNKTLYGNQDVLGATTNFNSSQNGFTMQGYSVTTAGGNVLLSNNVYPANGTITTNGGSVTVATGLLQLGSGGGLTITSGGGAINFNTGVIDVSSAAGKNLILNAGAGTITFASTVDTAANVSITAGTVNFNGTVGGTTALGTVSITSVNDITLPAIRGASIAVQTTGAAKTITVGNTQTSTATTGTAISFTATGDIIVSSATPVSMAAGGGLSFSAGGATKLNTAATYSTRGGAISFAGAVVLAADVTLNSANGAVTIGVTLNGDADSTRSLTVDAGTGAFTTGIIGNSNKLKDLTVTADDVVLGGNLSGNGVLTLQATTASRTMSIGATGGQWSLDATEIGYIQNGWSSIMLGNANHTGGQTITGATWHDPLTLRTATAGTRSLSGAMVLDDGAGLTIQDGTLNLTGTITMAGSGLFNTASAVGLNGSNAAITADGSLTFNGAVGLAGSGTRVTSNNGNITFNSHANKSSGSVSTISAPNGAITFALGVNGNAGSSNRDLTISGNSITVTSGTIGTSTAPIASLNITSGSTLTLPTIYAASMTVTANGASSDITLASGKTLNASATTGSGITLWAGRNIIIDSSAPMVMAGGSLSLTAGAGTKLNTAATYNTNGGTIRFTGAVTLGADVTLQSGNADITLNNGLTGDVSGSRSLSVAAGTGTFTASGMGSASVKLRDLSITADDVALNGDLYGSGDFLLQPASSAQAMRIGGSYSGVTAGFLTLETAEIAHLKNGWNSLTFGRTNAQGQPATSVGTSSWSDPVTFRITTGGSTPRSISVDGVVSSTDGASITFSAYYVTLNGQVNAAGDVTMGTTSTRGLTVAGASSISSANGTITLNTIKMGGALALDAGTGAIQFLGDVYQTENVATANLSATAGTIGFGGNMVGSINGAAINLAGTETLGTVTLTATNSMALPSIKAKTILVQTTGAAADITLASGSALTATATGNALTIASGRNFINSSGSATPFSLTGGGRWLVYSADPANNARGGLMPTASDFGKTYGANAPATIGSGNRFVYSTATAPTIALTTGNLSVIYGNAIAAGDLSLTYASGLVGGDSWGNIGLTGSHGISTSYVQGTTGYSPTAYAGMVSATTGTLSSPLGYQFNFTAADLTLVKRTLTVSLSGSISKTYDGTDAATVAGSAFTLGNIYNSDAVGLLDTTGTYNDKNAGTGKTVTVNALTLSGAKAGNYDLAVSSVQGNVGVVTRRDLTIGGVTVAGRTYDGTTAATLNVSSAVMAGDIGGDDVVLDTASATGNFSSANAGTRSVTVAGFGIHGDDAGNYALAQPVGLTAIITKRTLTVTAATKTMVYGNALPVGSLLYSGFAGSEGAGVIDSAPIVTLTVGGLLDVGTYIGKYTVSGGSDVNYDFTFVAGDLHVTPRVLTVTTQNQTKALGAPDPIFSGSTNLLASDAALISWVYAPTGYAGAPGTYRIEATANDPNYRLSNYVRSNQYGQFTVFTSAASAADALPASVSKVTQSAIMVIEPPVMSPFYEAINSWAPAAPSSANTQDGAVPEYEEEAPADVFDPEYDDEDEVSRPASDGGETALSI